MKIIHLYDVIPSKNRGEAAILSGLARIIGGASETDASLHIVSRSADLRFDEEAYASLVERIVEIPDHPRWRMVLFQLSRALDLFLSCILYWLLGDFTPHFNSHARAIAEADIVLYGHDNIVATNGFTIPILVLSIFCRVSGKRCILAYGSVGPFSSRWKRLLAYFTLKNFSHIFLRDVESWHFVKGILPKAVNIELVPDPAFLMPAAEQTDPIRLIDQPQLRRSFPKKILGVTVASPIVDQIEGDPEIFMKEFCDGLSAYLRTDPSRQLLMVPHVFGPRPSQDDRRLISDLVSRFPEGVRERVHSFSQELRAEELKGVLRNMEGVVGMRTHSIIAALSCGVPTLGISLRHRFKTNGIFTHLFEIPELLQFAEELSADSLHQTLEYLDTNHATLAEQISQRMYKVSRSLEESGPVLLGE